MSFGCVTIIARTTAHWGVRYARATSISAIRGRSRPPTRGAVPSLLGCNTAPHDAAGHERDHKIAVFVRCARPPVPAHTLLEEGMSVKSKARQIRRAKHESAAAPTKQVRVTVEEKRAAGAIMGALLEAITFGTLEQAPPSRA